MRISIGVDAPLLGSVGELGVTELVQCERSAAEIAGVVLEQFEGSR